MLRLLILCLVLSVRATSEGENEASGDFGDDEEGDNEEKILTNFDQRTNAELDKTASNGEDGLTNTAIIAAVCLVALAAVAIVAVILVRRRMQNRQQGVYSVPVNQSEKPAI